MTRRLELAVLLLLLATGCASTHFGEGGSAVEAHVTGNRGVSQRTLLFAARREIESFATKGHHLADLADAAYSMEVKLRQEGFPFGKVQFHCEPSEKDVKSVVFAVDEGKQAHLGEIFLLGVTHYSRDMLKERFFRFPGTGFFETGPPLYRESDVESAAKDLESFYLGQGYYRVEIDSIEPKWNKDFTKADVFVRVKEGPRYTVETVEVRGSIPSELAAKVESIRKDLEGSGYTVRAPSDAAAQIRALLLGRGYQRATVKGSATLDDKAAAATITIQVDAGEIYRLRDVRISGNKHVKTGFIRSQVPLKKGDVLAQNKIEKGIDNLYRAGTFQSVRMRPARFDEKQATADLDLLVQELKAKHLDLHGGWGSYELLRGGARYSNYNLFGVGRYFSAHVDGSLKGYAVGADLADHYLLGTSRILRLSSEYLLRQEPSFTRNGVQITLELDQELPGPYALTAGYRIDAERATDVTGVIPMAEQAGFVTTAGVFLQLRRDTRDNRLLPSGGSLSSLGTFYSSPSLGADLDFVELSASYAAYRRLARRVVLAVGFQFRTRQILDDRTTLPIQQRLFLGGATSVRSFDQDELGPTDAMGDPLGGLTAAEASLELRLRIRGNFHAALFYDVGTVSERSFDVTSPLGHAIGIGLRYYLPVGPVRLDFGYNPGQWFAANHPWALHFAFGFSF